jgi:hypothetical protein
VLLVPASAAPSGLDTWYFARLLGADVALGRVSDTPAPPPMRGKVTPIRPELAWILTNMARVAPGALVLDPFAGTGSLLSPSVALGVGGDGTFPPFVSTP